MLEIHKNIIMEKEKNFDGAILHLNIHIAIAKIKFRMGANWKNIKFDILGFNPSFLNNFIASLIGCGRPIIDGLFGPLRIWEYPKIFRSNNVKKAIAAKVSKHVIR